MSAQATAVRLRAAMVLGLTLALGAAVGSAAGGSGPPGQQAGQILHATGVRGGLIVHLGCADGKLTAALRSGESYLVHGLDSEAENVRRAREHIRSLGLYGPVSVDRLSGKRLPYVDNLVNLVVSEDLGAVKMDEVMRVLCPQGVAYIKTGSTWTKTSKPRPEQIDEWTHYLHDASGNAVAHDSVVGPPRHFQWIGSPRWSRHHDRMASMSGLVSAGGRMFYIFDEGPTASVQLPPRWVLVARDAFNGTVLWKRPIERWHPHLWPFKSGPAQLPRRLVAVGDEVYVTLGLDAPLTALDAATGETIRTYQHSRATEEVIASDGVLFLLVNDTPLLYDDFKPVHRNIGQAKARVAGEWPWDERKRRIMAVRAETGEILWNKTQRVVPLTLAAVLPGKFDMLKHNLPTGRQGVIFHDGEKVVCLDRQTGTVKWNSEPVARRASISTAFGPTLVVYQDVVLFSGGTNSLTALSADSGETLWSSEKARSGHNCPEDVLVTGGLVWAGAIASGRDSGIFTGWDLHTGEVKSQFPPDVQTHWFHQRCYRSKATDQYLLPSRTGIEFVDFASKHWTAHHWVRGGCIYGILPCNGLVYAPPHSCGCYLDAKLFGFCALAAESPTRRPPKDVSDADRLERGEAYGEPVEGGTLSPRQDASPGQDEWPTYRHDPLRSGFTKTTVPADLKPAWQTDLGGRLSSVVIAAGKVFLAEVNAHTVHALDAGSGKTVWSYTTGGRVDSPPTIHQGRVLFGSADGHVYCLRATDGKLIWRFRAGPEDRRLTAFEQVEAAWPVPGSVLVLSDVVYCVAGRSMFLDGGIRFLRLEAKTGRKLSETVLDDRDPESGKNLQVHVKGLNMPTALPDVLSSDGRYVYMRTQRFDLNGVRQGVAPTDVADQQGEGVHLFSAIGFLDGSWFHRGYWVYGKSIASGAGGWFRAGRVVPAGRLLVLDDSSVYGYGRKPEYFRWSTPLEYHLFAAGKEPKIIRTASSKKGPAENRARAPQQRRRRGSSSAAPQIRIVYHWSQEPPLHARGMVLAGKTLFLAGPPDLLDEEAVFDHQGEAGLRAKLDEQTAAYEGRKGASLWAVSAADGKKLAEYELQFPPVWDGMAAAAGRLYLSTTDGKVLCLAGK